MALTDIPLNEFLSVCYDSSNKPEVLEAGPFAFPWGDMSFLSGRQRRSDGGLQVSSFGQCIAGVRGPNTPLDRDFAIAHVSIRSIMNLHLRVTLQSPPSAPLAVGSQLLRRAWPDSSYLRTGTANTPSETAYRI